ncbi:MAG: DUF1566 domain-containing protein [Campylobacterota bacterium]|nr:DUF1566 domain-containing protein [Campylobacterota bacterium]
MQKYMIFFLVVLFAGIHGFAEEKHENSVVTDKINAIYWQDNISSQKSSKDWDDAVLYCDELVLNGVGHWRLPTFKELFSIVDYTRVHPAINPVFSFVNEGTYWTSTGFAPSRSRTWTIDFRTGKTYYSYTTTNHAVRCVKDMPVKSAKESK